MSALNPSRDLISANILSIFNASSSPAFFDLKNTFLAAALSFISSIISTHLIVKLSTGAAATGAATGAAAAGAGAAATGAGASTFSTSKPSNLSPLVIFSCFSFTFLR